MQQKNQHGEQRQKPAAEHAIRQQPSEKAAGQKEEMRQQVSGKIDGSAVLQPQNALGGGEKDLERHAVMSMEVVVKRAFVPQDVV